MQYRTINSLSEIDSSQWNALLSDSNPWLRYEFLHALEQHKCVGQHVGWLPRHGLLEDNDKIIGAVPAYIKTNSFGEFVFDWVWASAYERAGLNYYPKLVTAVPFTPATGQRLLTTEQQHADKQKTLTGLVHGITDFVQEYRYSSAHWLFVNTEDKNFLESQGLMSRLSFQYHWHNNHYEDFSHYLSFFRSRNRKKIKRERQLVTEAGINIKILHGDELDDALWEEVYGFYQATFLKKGNYPSLTLSFFKSLSISMGRNLVIVIAELNGDIIAGAINFRSDETLYGRYWGCKQEFNSLHFEVCFYQGIEYCIKEGLQSFEPGAQGEHKIARGFLPSNTWSAHWIANNDFRKGIKTFLDQETQTLLEYRSELENMSPFRKAGEQ